MRVTLKNHRFCPKKILGCPNGFYEIEQHLVNFSRLGPLTSLKVDNDQIKNISSRKLFKEHQTKFSEQYFQTSRHYNPRKNEGHLEKSQILSQKNPWVSKSPKTRILRNRATFGDFFEIGPVNKSKGR